MEYKYNNFTKTLTIIREDGEIERLKGEEAIKLYKQLTYYEEK